MNNLNNYLTTLIRAPRNGIIFFGTLHEIYKELKKIERQETIVETIKEYSIDIRVTAIQETNSHRYPYQKYGCDIVNTDGEILVGITPNYPTEEKAVKAALSFLSENNLQKAC